MKNKIYIALAVLILLILSFSINKIRNSDKAIFNRIINQNGYSIREIQKPITFTAFIKPEWFPKAKGDVSELNVEIGKVNEIGIILESVIFRENDLYFNFNAKPPLNRPHGEFLYSSVIHADGTSSTYSVEYPYKVYTKDHSILINETGSGPESKFSFALKLKDVDLIKKGFTMEYKGSVLYEYSKKEGH
jgi:hypothetical protein